MPDYATGWMLAEIVATFPVVLRTDGARADSTAAIRVDIVQETLHTQTAEGAFKRADHRFGRVRWKRAGAVLACGSEFKHSDVS